MTTYVPFDERPFRLRMGLRPLEIDDWLEPDELRDAELAQKARLVAERHDDVVAVAAAAGADAARIDAACEELVDEIAAAQARAQAEARPRAHARSVSSNRPQGVDSTTQNGEVHPIVRAGLATQEDWAVMTPVGGELVMSAACVCFPTRWELRTKIGRPMAEVHRHVPFYADHIGRAVDSFFERLTAERPTWRLNWSLMDDPALFQPVHLGPAGDGPIVADDVGERVWLRVERQTLRRLPVTGAVVFGIRVHQRPLAALVAEPGALAAMRTAVANLPAATVDYKNLGGFTQQLDEWITRQLGKGVRTG